MTTEPIRNKEQLHILADYFLKQGQFRDYAMLVVGIHTALRISDLLNLKWADVYDESSSTFHDHIYLTEQKTGKKKAIALNDAAKDALRIYWPHHKGKYIFASRNGVDQPICRQQAWRVIKDACRATGINGKIACHSLRKTWGYHAWTSGAVSPVVITEIYNHSNYETTKRYLGVAQDDLDRAYLDMELF